LFISPPGRIANWTDWSIAGLRKSEWAGLHITFSTLFLLVTIIHVVFNWRPLVGYFKDRMTRRIGWRWEWAAAVMLAVGVFWATRAGLPPFSSLLALNETAKDSWDEPSRRAPIPHAELLTLEELAAEAKVELEDATERLTRRNLEGVGAQVVVKDLAERNGIPARQVFEIMVGETGESPRQTPGRGRHGAGGGRGQQTLEQFCAEEGIDMESALKRLEARGIRAKAQQGLREIAVENGFGRPFEIMDVIRGE
jgi:hypothetical protein